MQKEFKIFSSNIHTNMDSVKFPAFFFPQHYILQYFPFSLPAQLCSFTQITPSQPHNETLSVTADPGTNLWVEEDHEATVVCAETEMFKAVMGKRNNGNTAIRITEQIEAEEETENGRDPY